MRLINSLEGRLVGYGGKRDKVPAILAIITELEEKPKNSLRGKKYSTYREYREMLPAMEAEDYGRQRSRESAPDYVPWRELLAWQRATKMYLYWNGSMWEERLPKW